MLEISSRTNSLYRKFLSLTESKGLKKEGLFLVSGKNLVAECLKQKTLQIESEIYCEGQKPQCDPKLQVKLSQTLFDEIDVLGTHSPILMVQQPEVKEWDFSKTSDGLKILVPLGDPSNLGALLRSAEAFGVQNVILLKEAANPFLPKSVKASAGSIARVKLWKGPAVKDLKVKNLLAMDSTGESLPGFQWPKDSYLLIGEEGAGVPKIPGLKKVSIPTQKVESLNATVATSIALYDYSQKINQN